MFDSSNFIQPSDYIGENTKAVRGGGSKKPGPEINLMFMNKEQFEQWLKKVAEPEPIA